MLALAAAVLWGGGDFSGGMGAKHAGGTMGSALRVILVSHLSSFAVLLLIVWVRGDRFPQGAALWWGIGAGVTGGLALMCFYVALSRGAMGASAAVSGLLAAAIPAAVSAVSEGSPGGLRIFGFLVVNNQLEKRFYNAFASSLQMLGRHAEAVQYYSMASLFDIDDPLPTFHTAECFISMGWKDEARQALQFVIEQSTAAPLAEVKARAESMLQMLGDGSSATVTH